MILLDPRGFEEPSTWCDQITPYLEIFGSIPRFTDSWQDWARSVIAIPRIGSQGAPDPTYFDDWQDWAIRFVQVVNS